MVRAELHEAQGENMSRGGGGGGDYAQGKRQRETEKARRKQEKAVRRAHKREHGPEEPILTTAAEIVGNLPSIDEAMAMIENRATGQRSVAAIPCRLFVGGLAWTTSNEELFEAFSKFGPVSEAVVVKDRNTGQSRGFGFVTMENRKDAGRAIDGLHGSELNGRRLMVNVATER
jgi:RNA recognition motif-containing protein